MKEKVVYLLGAGFSAPLGIPVMSNFLSKSKDLFYDDPSKYPHFADVFETIKEMSIIKNYYQTDLFNIEEILSILEMREFLEGEERKANREEVIELKKKLLSLGYSELGFGKSENGYSWVVLVDSEDVEALDPLVWTCYPQGSSNNALQKSIARGRVWMLRDRPFKDRCNDT